MTPWQVIEEALAHMRPPRNASWLAERLGEKIQVVSNWKYRRVPPARFREISALLGLTLDQLEGLEPLPWDRANAGDDLPLSADLKRAILTLSDEALARLEGVMRAHLGLGNVNSRDRVKTFDLMHAETSPDRHTAESEAGARALVEATNLAPKSKHASKTHRGSARGKGGRRA